MKKTLSRCIAAFFEGLCLTALYFILVSHFEEVLMPTTFFGLFFVIALCMGSIFLLARYIPDFSYPETVIFLLPLFILMMPLVGLGDIQIGNVHQQIATFSPWSGLAGLILAQKHQKPSA